MNRNMTEVKSRVTEELYSNYTLLLNQMKKRREKNMLSNIHIAEMRIIGCEDFKDDSKDHYIAYIKGSMLDYLINERTNAILQNPEKTVGGFTDTYHFVRVNNKWLLEKTDNIVTVPNHGTLKNYFFPSEYAFK